MRSSVHDKWILLCCFQDSLCICLLNVWWWSILGVDFFEFILLEVCWTLWMCGLFFCQICKFGAIISSNSLSALSLLETPSNVCLYIWWSFTCPWDSVHFSSFFFLSAPQTETSDQLNINWSSLKFTHFLLLIVQIC